MFYRVGSVAEFPFQYPGSVKGYRFRDTEKYCALAYPQLNRPVTESKMHENKTLQCF